MEKREKLEPGRLPENHTLSVCMIVRDEGKVLARCLESVKGVADEIIVVDTGSKDDTISIAKHFDARIFHFSWCDDFSAARNESIKHATGDWILQIDADEELLANSILPLKKAMYIPWCLLYVIRCDSGATSRSGRFSWITRLFRNHQGVRYSRPYHEIVRPSIDSLTKKDTRWCIQYESSIIIRHYGYDRSELPGKRERGLRIMEAYIEKNPDDAYILTKLGGAYCDSDRQVDAEKHLKKALKINPNSPETNYNLGLTLQEQGKLDSAIQFYKQTVAIDPHYTEAYSTLGTAYGQKGMVDEAIAEFRKALTIDPSCAGAHNNLGVAYGLKGMTDKAIVEFKKALDIDSSLSDAYKNLAVAYYSRMQYDIAIKHCDKAVKLGADVDPQFIKDIKAKKESQ